MKNEPESYTQSIYRETPEQICDGIISINTDFEVLSCNSEAKDLLRINESELIGQSIWDIFPDGVDTFAQIKIEAAVTNNQQSSYKQYDAETHTWFEVRVYPNNTGGMLFFTELNDAGSQQRNIELFHPTEDTIGVGGWKIDLPSEDLYWSDEVYRIRDLPLDYIPTLSEGYNFYHPEDRPVIKAAVENLKRTGATYDLELREVTDDGEIYWVRTTGVPQYNEDGEITALRGVYREITERKEQEKELREKTRAIEEAPLGITLTDHSRENNPITYANQAFLSITGYDESEVIGRSHRLLEGENTDTKPIDDIRNAIDAAKPVTVQLQNYRKDSSVFWNHVKIAPVTDVDGTTRNFVWFHQDITHQKRHEQQLERQRDNLELLTQMMSHDLTNDIQVIQGVSQFLDDHVDNAGQIYVDQILEKVDHAVSLLQTGRELTKTMFQSNESPQPVSLKQSLETQIEKAQSSYTGAVVTIDGKIPAIDVIADQMLDSVFRNLLHNAITHNDKEVPEVAVSVTDTEDSVLVHIADNGPGITEAQKETVFGQGEKALESGGTGLGLYLVDTLIDKYGGSVSIDDHDSLESMNNIRENETERDGTVFSVTLNRA